MNPKSHPHFISTKCHSWYWGLVLEAGTGKAKLSFVDKSSKVSIDERSKASRVLDSLSTQNFVWNDLCALRIRCFEHLAQTVLCTYGAFCAHAKTTENFETNLFFDFLCTLHTKCPFEHS